MDEEDPKAPKPVDDPNLPETGDSDEFEEEPIREESFEEHGEVLESRDTPNDLSEIEKEFEE